MTNDNYMNAINEAKKLLKELLNDPEHGKLTFKGVRGLNDLVITGPEELDDVISRALVAIDDAEWMALGYNVCEPRQWQRWAQCTSEHHLAAHTAGRDTMDYRSRGQMCSRPSSTQHDVTA